MQTKGWGYQDGPEAHAGHLRAEQITDAAADRATSRAAAKARVITLDYHKHYISYTSLVENQKQYCTFNFIRACSFYIVLGVNIIYHA